MHATDPEINRYLVNVLAARLRDADEATAAASFLTVKARVARALLELAKHLGEDAGAGRILIRHKIGQGDLAAMAGVARENVSRVLTQWKRQKIVTQLPPFYGSTTARRLNASWKANSRRVTNCQEHPAPYAHAFEDDGRAADFLQKY